MAIRRCTLDDCANLAVMNKQLIDDEGHENPMNVDQLRQRMEGFLKGDYQAFFFTASDLNLNAYSVLANETGQQHCFGSEDVLGYALINMAASPKYLRQFFIAREHRREGYGKRFFRELLDGLGIDTVDIEVLIWNETGIEFWKNLGFQSRSIYMRYRA